MIWYVLLLAFIVGGLVGILTADLPKALRAALFTFLGGVVLSLLILLSGILGG